MKFLFLAQSLHGASSRYRVLQFLPFLEDAGVEAQVTPVPSGWLERRRLFQSASGYDLVFLQKRLLDPLLVRTLRGHAKRLVFDLDDAIMARPSGAASWRRRARFARMARAADLVIAGNSYLGDAAQAHAAQVEIIPTVLDLRHYPDAPNWLDGPHFTLGWIGSRSTLPYLESIAPAIDELAHELPQLRLKIVCDAFFDLASVPLLKKNWSSDDEAADLQSMDVGLMPLPDNAWTRGKCGFKILQYSAAWRPTICSPVGVNPEIVTADTDGLFASTPEEWQDAIRRLARSPELCRGMGSNGRARVADAYSLEAVAKTWVATLVELAR